MSRSQSLEDVHGAYNEALDSKHVDVYDNDDSGGDNDIQGLAESPRRTQSIMNKRRRDPRRNRKNSVGERITEKVTRQLTLSSNPAMLLQLEKEAGEYEYPNSIIQLKFRDPDMERDFRAEFDINSTSIFRGWAIIFLLFHVVTFFGRDLQEYGADTNRDTLQMSRVPSILVAIICIGFTYMQEWKDSRVKLQYFLAGSLFVQAMLLLVVSFSTLEEDDTSEIAIPNAVVAAQIVCYTSYRLRMPMATLVGWSIQVFTNFAFLIAIGTDYGNLSWSSMYINIPMTAFNIIGMMTCYQIEKTERENFREIRQYLKESALASYEQKRGEYLLYNILPERIVQRLKTQPTIAQRVSAASVSFVCVENLIDLTSAMSTISSVQTINSIFHIIDQRAREHGVEKVKTIQNKFMCVSGAPEESANHAQQMADMLLAVFEDFDNMDNAFTVRAGMSSGRIVAGVIGLQKFCWDIWGDTVNTASRMEYPKSDAPLSGVIRASISSYQLLKESHNLEFLGDLEVKGKASIATYRVMSRKSQFGNGFDNGASNQVDAKYGDEDDHDYADDMDNDSDLYDQGDLVDENNMSNNSASNVWAPHHGGPDPLWPKTPRNSTMVQSSASSQGLLNGTSGGASVEMSRRESNSGLNPQTPRTRKMIKSAESRGRLAKSFGATHNKRRSSVEYDKIPVLDMTQYINDASFEVPKWREMTPNMRTEFFLKRFDYNMTNQPTLRTSMIVAVFGYMILGLGYVLFETDLELPNNVLVVYFCIVPFVWALHYLAASKQWYTPNVSSALAVFSICAMIAASYLAHRALEKSSAILPGSEFYAVLPIVYALYLSIFVFNMRTRWVFATVAINYLLLAIADIVNYAMTDETVYFWTFCAGTGIFGVYVADTLESLSLVQWHFTRSAMRDRRIIQQKKDEADKLLYNIVPDHIVRQLASFTDMSGVARRHDDVAILFSDIAGFTKKSESLNPIQLVNWLNGFFTLFDQLAKVHCVEKIKTIGDAYVACTGLTEGRRHHVNDLVNLAIELQANLKKRAESKRDRIPVTLRIGIHVGSVLAGIIGKRKFQYDVFGHAVTVAEHMESSGTVGRVHIHDHCRKALAGADRLYSLERAADFVKTDGTSIPTWFIDAKPGGSRTNKAARRLGAAV
jgi:class 3 adenylate cyclase